MWDPVFASLSPWPSPPCLSLMFLPLLRIPVIGLRSPPRSKLTLSQASYSHPQRLYFQTGSVSQGPEIGTWTACQGPALHMPHYSPQDTLPIWLCGPTYRLTLAMVFSCGHGVAGSIKIQDPQHKAQALCTAPACHRSPPWGAAPALPLTGHPRAGQAVMPRPGELGRGAGTEACCAGLERYLEASAPCDTPCTLALLPLDFAYPSTQGGCLPPQAGEGWAAGNPDVRPSSWPSGLRTELRPRSDRTPSVIMLVPCPWGDPIKTGQVTGGPRQESLTLC